MFVMMKNENKNTTHLNDLLHSPIRARGVDVVVGGTAMMMNLLSVEVLSETEDSGEISTSLWVIKSPVGDEIYSPLTSATWYPPLFGIISRVGDGLPCCFACEKNRRSTLWP